MKYRKFGKTDIEVSILGFGAMRLPIIGGDHTAINEPEAIKMIRYAIDHGVNYVDTAYPYHGGKSEVVVGKALKDGYRNKTYVATKLPVWLTNSKEDCDKYLDEQLKRLDMEYVDFYLLHALNKDTWNKIYNFGVLDWAEKKIREGKFRYLGFSFHDDLETFKKIVDAYDWTFCQIQYNYIDIDYQAGREGLQYAANKGLAVVIMEPLRGGNLVNPPAKVRELMESYKVKRNPVEWALLWLWNQKEVTTVLSGMSTLEQVIENIKIAEKAEVGILDREDIELVERLRDTFLGIKAINCTQCQYCLPCPYGVDIPRNFHIYNEGFRYNNWGHAKWLYNNTLKPEEMASNCQKCGICETKCPQNLPIRDLLEMVARELGG
ncbi:MAG: aldo/keto reductase [Dictyoglomus sp. NZ13-RE01]|nr:MAG: aldo/keto reductase [Dictyoglomus sp. NZ13-RE01]